METEAPLVDMGSLKRKIIGTDTPRFLAGVLDLPRHAVVWALAPGGRLIQCGLLKGNRHPGKLARLEFHSEELAVHLIRKPYDPRELLKLFSVVTSALPDLGPADCASGKQVAEQVI